MRLDYFYNTEGENFRFYQIPALLLEEEEYRGISDTAKILYGVLLSRLALSRKNSWIEKDTGRLYITYNLKQLVEKLGRRDRTISKAMKQLSEVGLIEKKKRGQGKPDIIYVMNFTAVHKEGTKEIVPEEQMEQDYQDKLAYILMHPVRNWFNRKTSAVIGSALTAWAMFVCYYLTYYRNFHPDQEHGVAEWADVPKTAKRLYGKGEEPVTCLSKNITVNAKALPNMHILILGGSGDGKTTSLLIPNILLANMTNIILDVKGDLLKNYGGYLKEKGIAVKSLNFKDMAQSDQYNPFRYIENYTDMVELITNIQTSVRPPDAQKGDPFWDDGVGLYL